ncbi:unannotated protein [freshwater metagenome]|uniref:Unannotated protein n=1 Tax=freshwater metagenome TaxID=449393 RepID=A0A6J7U5P0_9ZZZZ|nr:hypothetical protein [Actinomycetota bacterium]
MKAVRSLQYFSVLLLLATGLIVNLLQPSEALAGITDNPGFSNGNYSVCNHPNQGDSVTSYGPDRNLSGITLTSTNWRCSAGGAAINGESVVAVKQPLLMEKLDLQTPRFGGGGYSKDLVSISWDYDNDGTIDLLDSGPWNSWYLDRGHPYARGTYFSSSHSFDSTGSYTVKVTATYDDSSTDVATGIVKVVSDTPTAVINRIDIPTGIPNDAAPVLTGTSQKLSASRSTSVGGIISKYEWDLDGDNEYEIDSGVSDWYTTTFASVGTKTVRVRVTSRGGSTATASMPIEVRLAPPKGEPGMSILEGASYVNSKTVKLNLVWPEYATEARISNDGGFSASKIKTVALSNSVDWELDDSVKGVYTKVVYVRFNGSGIDTTKTYSDDIILDTNAPVVESSSAAAVSESIDVTLKATDDITGVDKVQIKNGSITVTKDYSNKISVAKKEIGVSVSSAGLWKFGTSSIEVRVSDMAGNWSEFKTLTLAAITTGSTLPSLKTTTAKSIASYAKLKVASTSKVTLKVAPSSAKFCRVSGSTLKGLKTGSCKVTVTVTPKKGRASFKTVMLKVAK